MKKITRLTETDLNRIVKKVISEDTGYSNNLMMSMNGSTNKQLTKNVGTQNPLVGCIKQATGQSVDPKNYPTCGKVLGGDITQIFGCMTELSKQFGLESANKIYDCYKAYSKVKY